MPSKRIKKLSKRNNPFRFTILVTVRSRLVGIRVIPILLPKRES